MSRSRRQMAAEFTVRLVALTDIYNELLRKVTDRANIRPERLRVLMLVRSQPSSRMVFEALQTRIGLKSYELTRIADRLEKSGRVRDIKVKRFRPRHAGRGDPSNLQSGH